MNPDGSVADTLPHLYRSVLDAIGELEARGGREAAARYRAQATQTYAAAWDETSRRRLEALRARIEAARNAEARATARR